MASFDFNELGKILDDDKGTGVSFEGKAKNWSTKDEVQEVVDAIQNCPKLDYLNLEGNTLGVEAAVAIGDALIAHPEFKKALWKDLFTGRLKTEIPEALKKLGLGMITARAQLTVLDLSDNALGPNGMIGLVDLLKSPTCYSLEELKLNNCGLGTDGGTMLAGALDDCLSANLSDNASMTFQLKVFIAGRNRLENNGATALAKVFGKLKTLEHVAMPQNGINHVGIRALSEALKLNENMKILNLNDNTIGKKGAHALAEALESMQKLEELDVGDCLLKTSGAIYLGEALQERHTNLEILNLGGNEIRPDGGLTIAAAMHNKVNIHSLILSGNEFDQECRTQLEEILKTLGKFDVLDVNDGEENGEGDDDVDHNDVDEEEDEDEDEDEDGEEGDEEEDEETDENYDQYVESDTEEAGDEGSFLDPLSTSKSFKSTFDTSVNNLTNDLNNTSVYFDGEYNRPNTVETFCSTPNPTEAMFNALEDNNKIDAFRGFLQTFSDEEYLIHLVFAILKCSAIAVQNKEALEVAQILYKECFNYATTTNQVSRVKNFFLIQLGLLKSEEKFKPLHNIESCRFALKHALSMKCFDADVTNTFECFLEHF